MKIYNVTEVELNAALAKANLHFAGNISFKRVERVANSRIGKGGTYIVTLTVNNSHKPGAKVSPPHFIYGSRARHIKAACWHAHGEFINGLPVQAHVVTNLHGKIAYTPGDVWVNPIVRPIDSITLGDCCECENTWN